MKRNGMRKYLRLVLAAGLFFGGMAAGQPAMAEEGFPAAVGYSEPREGAPVGTLAVDPALRCLGLEVERFERDTVIKERFTIHQAWQEIGPYDGDNRSLLHSQDFGGLQGALREYNRRLSREATQMRDKLQEQAIHEIAERPNFIHGYRDVHEIYVRRADSLAVSFIAEHSSFTGGAHGMYAYEGVNFDAATGRRLVLADVFRDKKSLARNLWETLRARYGVALFDSAEKTVTEAVAEDRVSWTLDPRGATFYFNPYDVAPYASGLLSVTFLFDERPGLFLEKYKRGPASYCETLPTGRSMEISLRDDGSGRRDSLEVWAGEGSIHITVNGAAYVDGSPVSGNDITAVHTHTAEGKNFLYVDCEDSATGERMLRIYDLDGRMPAFIAASPQTFRRKISGGEKGWKKVRQWIMTDPREFTVYDSHPSAGQERRTHTVEMQANGCIAFG